MNAFLEARTRPLNLAHRGASAYAPENTLAAFRLAAEMGADGIELDSKLSRDGRVVIVHDLTVDRTTDGSGRVSSLTLEELKRLDAGSKFAAEFVEERVPTLEETLYAIGDRLLINVELTNYASRNDGLERKVVDVIERRGLVERVMVSSFDPLSLRKVKRAASHIVCGLLVAPDMPVYLHRAWLARLIPGLDAHHPHHTMIDAALVRRLHRRSKRINTCTVNEELAMRRLVAIGVDGIMTDRPDALKGVVQSAGCDG